MIRITMAKQLVVNDMNQSKKNCAY